MRKVGIKIPVRIDWLVDENKVGGIEVTMNLDDFELSGTSIRESIRNFKKKYLEAIKQAKKIDDAIKKKKKRGKQRDVSTTNRWNACKILADFNNKFENEFEIKNYKEAYSRDFNLPMRSIRTYLDFGTHFLEKEILDKIPYSTYAELTFVLNELKRKNLFESEKKKLLEIANRGNVPNRDEYRKHLRTILQKNNKPTLTKQSR